MYKNLLFFSLIFFIVSCSEKNNAFKYFNKSQIETKFIQYTKRTNIIKNNSVKVIFSATYLNGIENKDYTYEKEKFLVSLYFVNSNEQDTTLNNFEIKLNNKKAIKLEKIDENYKYSNILKNSWGSKYIIQFNTIEKVYKLNLELSNKDLRKSLVFFK